ncbi:hypothetical protein LV716_13765 [Flagellimonas sp. HMM57]|uniref:hypothetical protein n=1 Tax=unclassified Flagellimonas TaxID=2644544 RepID=UPI0013D1230C|nr:MULTISPECIES: hypothetical protein [unclassified Flagellimonas]UII75314.1 hypothetical protein LV716_13765 [Flagellimonas sp. HMM57]
MKKKYRIIQLLLLMMVVGCQTENDTDPTVENSAAEVEEIVKAQYDFKVEAKNGILSFPSQDDFDKAIEYVANLGDENFAKWENEISFKSLSSISSDSDLENLGINDRLLAVFLNPDMMLTVGENTFKTDYLANEVVMVNNSDFTSKRSFSGKSRRVFDTDDDIFGLLDGSVTEDENLTSKRKYKRCKRNKKTQHVYIGQDQYDLKVVYQAGWPARSLQAKIKRKDGEPAVQETNIGLQTQRSTFTQRRKRNSNCDRRYNNTGRGGNGREYSLRIYYSSRALEAFDYNVNFYGSNISGQMSKFLRITCGRCR